MASFEWPPEGSGSGGGGVTSLNGETGDIDITSVDSSITITPSGQTIDLSVASAPIVSGDLTDAGTDGIVVTGGIGAVLGSGTSLAQHVADTSHNGYLASADWNTFNGKQAAGSYITALTGDVTASGPGSAAATLTATSNATLTTLSGLTTATSLASVGTITSGTWNGTTVAIAHGGTGQVTAAAAFNALSPITTAGDMIYSPSGATSQRLAVGSTGNVLTVSGGVPTWAPPATAGTVTAVSVVTANGLAGSSSGGATPALTLSTTVTGILSGNGTTISAASTTGSGSVVLATSPTIVTPTIAKISNLTMNGYVKTSAGDGTLSVQTTPLPVADTIIAAQAISTTVIDWATGNLFTQSNSSTNRTFTFSNQASGQTIVVRLTQTSGTVTWPTVKWPDGTPPTPTASGTDVYTFINDGTSIYGSVVQAMA